MAVRLRLTRVGKKKQPSYRIVAADARSPRDGKYLEIVGTYDPRREPSAITVDNEKAIEWLKKGAQPSERVQKLLVISGFLKSIVNKIHSFNWIHIRKIFSHNPHSMQGIFI